MWQIQVVKDTTSCFDRVPPFTYSQITGDDDGGDDKYGDNLERPCISAPTSLDVVVDIRTAIKELS